jgi:hypothetical protein
MQALSLITLLAVLSTGTSGQEWRRLPTRNGVWNGTPIEYKVLNGWALVEGDILLAPVSELEQSAPRAKAGRESSVIRQQFRLWPDHQIPYTIDAELPDQERVREAIKHWEALTPIRFVERTNELDWVTFRPDYSGCNSQVGLHGGQQDINLDWSCDTNATIHEIGHAVGLWHTQSRADRDRWIRIRYESIDKDWWAQFDRHISDARDIGPYPFNSVMHYSAYGASKDGAQVMVSVPPGIPIGQEGGLTPLDVWAVHQLYGLPMTKAIVSSTPLGLRVRVDGSDYVTPAEFDWQAGETHTISAPADQVTKDPDGRYRFAGWSDGGDADHAVTVTAELTVFDARYRRMVRVEAAAAVTSDGSEGRVELSPQTDDGYYPAGTRVRLRAIAGAGSTFLSWCGDDDIPDLLELYINGCSVEQMDIDVDQPVQLTARFTSGPVTSIVSTPPGRFLMVDDAVYITPIRFAWQPDSEHELTAFPYDFSLGVRSYFEFKQWSEGENASLKVKAGAEARTITASYDTWHEFYAWCDYFVSSGSTLPSSIGLTLNPAPEAGAYFRDGTEVEITPPQNDRWQFVNWYRDATGSFSPARIKMTGYTSIVANFLGYSWLNAGAITHDAKRQPDILAPGQRVRLYWNGNTPDAPVEAQAGQQSLPTTLGGVEVRVNGKPSPLVRVSKNEIVFVVPDSAWTDQRSAEVVVVTGRAGTLNVSLSVLRTNPGIYTADGTGTGPAIDRSLQAGEEFSITATGLAADSPVEAIFGQTSQEAVAEPDPANPGIWLVRTRVPRDAPPGPLAFYLLTGDKVSQPGVQINVVN